MSVPELSGSIMEHHDQMLKGLFLFKFKGLGSQDDFGVTTKYLGALSIKHGLNRLGYLT